MTPNKCRFVAGFIAARGGCDWYERANGYAAGGRAEADDDSDPAADAPAWMSMLPAKATYQMQPTEPEQAENARRIAAYRTANAAHPDEGRSESGLTDAAINMFPFVGAAREAAGGHYGAAATDAAWDALPFGLSYARRLEKPIMAAWGVGSAMSPDTAEGAERFNWPVRTSYGKTIDMPVNVNPSKSMILRELAQSPHGDVRALRAPNGDVYLWPANEAMHVDIADTFDLPFKTRHELQKNSYLFNKRDVEAAGGFSNFDDLVKKIDAAASGGYRRGGRVA